MLIPLSSIFIPVPWSWNAASMSSLRSLDRSCDKLYNNIKQRQLSVNIHTSQKGHPLFRYFLEIMPMHTCTCLLLWQI